MARIRFYLVVLQLFMIVVNNLSAIAKNDKRIL
ncbi:hypothetical protein FLSI110296_06540 [Flavobacterium sinopsychrotolerans]